MKKHHFGCGDAIEHKLCQKSISSLFVKNRDLGLICDSLLPIVQRCETVSYMICSIGPTFHIYNLDKLELLFIGPNYENLYGNVKITSLAGMGDMTIIALYPLPILSFCDRGKESFNINLDTVNNSTQIIQLESLGNVLFAMYENGEIIQIDVASKGTVCVSLCLEVVNASFPLPDMMESDIFPIQMLHPSTYLNKILISTSDNRVCLWNFHSGKIIHTLNSISVLQNHSIVFMLQTPALDIIAVSFSNGFIGFFNIKVDQLVFRLQQPGGAANCICFRTGNDEPFYLDVTKQQMITSNPRGDLFVWDLEEKTILATIEYAHSLGVTSISMIPGRPVFITTGCDNSIKEWIFPSASSTNVPELYKYRCGFSTPPAAINFYGDDGHFLLSYGSDRSFRAFSLYKDSQAFELSQSKLQNNLGPAISFSSVVSLLGSNNGSNWDNIITCHSGISFAQTWSFAKKSIGSHQLLSTDGSIVTTSAISHCGHFGFIGTSSGRVEIYNMQSGLHRGFVKHDEYSVKAVASSSDGTTFLSAAIASLTELNVKFWSFKTKRLLSEQKYVSLQGTSWEPIKKVFISQHVDSDLVALGLDTQICVYDFSLGKVVRILHAPIDHILNSISFSGDGKWIISTGNDYCVRIWDIPSGTLLDCIALHPILPIGASLSPLGDKLAVIDTSSVAIHLFTNKSFYGSVVSKEESSDESYGPSSSTPYQNPSSNEFISLSASNSTFWSQLVHLDIIKEKSRPVMPASKSESVPFFLNEKPLQTESIAKPKDAKSKALSSSVINSSILSSSEANILLNSALESLLLIANNNDEVCKFLRSSTASVVDYGIRTLSSVGSLHAFISFLSESLNRNCDFDLINAYLHIFLDSHTDTLLLNMSEFNGPISSLVSALEKSTDTLDSSFHSCVGLLHYCNGRLL